jgi:hypothetical protein
MARTALNVPQPDDRLTIVCLYCQHPQEVGRRTLTVTCKNCNKRLIVEDIHVKAYEARRSIDTCGTVTIEKRGHAVTDRIHCGGMVVRGKVKGEVISRGPVRVGPEAEIRGNVTAPSLSVGAGAVLQGVYHIGPDRRQGET